MLNADTPLILPMIPPQAFPAWRDTTAKYRSDLLRRWFNLCKENEDDLAEILQIEQGKPIREAKGEVAYGSTFLEWFSEECRRINGEVSLCLRLDEIGTINVGCCYFFADLKFDFLFRDSDTNRERICAWNALLPLMRRFASRRPFHTP